MANQKIIALSDSLAPWHSFWIRFGQYISSLPWEINITDDAEAIQNLANGDSLFIYRYSPKWVNLTCKLDELRRKGVNIVADIDDYLWNATHGWDTHRLKGLTLILRKSNTITCSTENLESILKIMFPRNKIILLRNSTPQILRNLNKQVDNKITLCWTGAPWTRPKDLLILRPLAKWILNNQRDVLWKHIGHSPKQISFADIVGIPKSNVETVELCGYQEYLTHIEGDIGLAPVANNIFNNFKSEIKLLEYSSAHMSWIGSDSEAYNQCCQRWRWPGRLCNSPEEWIEHFEILRDHTTRVKEANRLCTISRKKQPYSFAVNQWHFIFGGQGLT